MGTPTGHGASRLEQCFSALTPRSTPTRVAYAYNRWSHYKIDQKKELIGVFVSIVSTKIPFKGTGKEFIGSDIQPISRAVKRALQVRVTLARVIGNA